MLDEFKQSNLDISSSASDAKEIAQKSMASVALKVNAIEVIKINE